MANKKSTAIVIPEEFAEQLFGRTQYARFNNTLRVLAPSDVLDKIHAGNPLFDPEEFAGMEPFTWRAVVSNTNTDTFFTHMMPSTLRNYAEDSENGVPFQHSHDHESLPIGRSLAGRYIRPSGDKPARVEADFYTFPGIRSKDISSDDFIRGVKSGIFRDVSVGFFGGRYICDVCNRDMMSYECGHFPGMRYSMDDESPGMQKYSRNPPSYDNSDEAQIATAGIDNARLAEVSTVFHGSTPGAGIVKARSLARAGELSPELAGMLEAKYGITLPVATRYSGIEIPKGVNEEMKDTTRANKKAPPMDDDDEDDRDMGDGDMAQREMAEDDRAMDYEDDDDDEGSAVPPKKKKRAAGDAWKGDSGEAAEDEGDKASVSPKQGKGGSMRAAGDAWHGDSGEAAEAEGDSEAVDATKGKGKRAAKKKPVVDSDMDGDGDDDKDGDGRSGEVFPDTSKTTAPGADIPKRFIQYFQEPQRAELEEFGVTRGMSTFQATRQLVQVIRRLESYADDGKAYRKMCLDETMEAAVKAMGPDTDVSKYRRMLRNESIETIRQMGADWAKMAGESFKPGRLTADRVEPNEDEKGGRNQRAVAPDYLYGAY